MQKRTIDDFPWVNVRNTPEQQWMKKRYIYTDENGYHFCFENVLSNADYWYEIEPLKLQQKTGKRTDLGLFKM